MMQNRIKYQAQTDDAEREWISSRTTLVITVINGNDIASKFKATICILSVFYLYSAEW